MMKHKIPAVFLAAALLTGQALYLPVPAMTELTVSAGLEEGRGQIGADVFWRYDFNGTLTIYGNGAIEEMSQYPWTQTDISKELELTTIIIEQGVTNLPEGIFQRLSSVYGVEIADSVTSIGANAFAECSNLTGITLPESLTTLSGTAFDGTNIHELHLPPALTSITDGCFEGCTALEGISGESTAYTADGNALYTAGFAKLLWYTPRMGGDLSIREGVTEIGTAVFENRHITNLILPASLTVIGERAFEQCYPQTITFNGTQAQWNAVQIGGGNALFHTMTVVCTGEEEPEDEGWILLGGDALSPIEWKLDENGVLTIRGTGNMPEETYSANIPWYPQRAQIKEVVIGEGIRNIPDYYFEDCDNLTKITFPKTLRYIGYMAFWGCDALTSVDLQHCTFLSEMEAMAFDCPNLAEVKLPDTLRYVNGYTFYSYVMTSIRLPAQMDTLYGTFSGCTALQTIGIDSANPYFSCIDGILYDKSGKTLLAYPPDKPEKAYLLPAHVTAIGEYAFSDAQNLESIYVPDTVTEIGHGAFSLCDKLRFTRLPQGLTALPVRLFYASWFMDTVILPKNLTLINSDSLHFNGGTSALYFPGTQAQWNAITVDCPSVNDYTTDNLAGAVHIGAAADLCISADLNADFDVDALDASEILQYAAAAGSGTVQDYAQYCIMQGRPVHTVDDRPDIESDALVSAEFDRDGTLTAADAAVILRYAAAYGSGYRDGLSAFLQ